MTTRAASKSASERKPAVHRKASLPAEGESTTSGAYFDALLAAIRHSHSHGPRYAAMECRESPAFRRLSVSKDFCRAGSKLGDTDFDLASIWALEFLGGRDVFSTCPFSRSDLHHAILDGMPGKALDHLVANVVLLTPEKVGDAVGVSTRTLRRRKDAPDAPLSPDQGGRAVRFAEFLARAAVIFGGQREAELWFDTPAMGLNQQKPIDLMATPVGAQLVDEFMGRLEHGVYA